MDLLRAVRNVAREALGWKLIVHKELQIPPTTHEIMVPLEYGDAVTDDIRLQVFVKNNHNYKVTITLGWVVQGYNWRDYVLGANEGYQEKVTLRGMLDEKMGYLLPVNIEAPCYVEVWALP